MTRYVLGFMFDETLNRLLLIHKQRPVWQLDKLNGVGGKVEGVEISIEAMIREFKEETGIQTIRADWQLCANMDGPDWKCAVYTGRGPIDIAYDVTDEPLQRVYTDYVSEYNIIDNLRYLVPLAKEVLEGKIHSIPYFSYGGNSGE